MAENESLLYGRVSGWGRTGPRASTPGHDINYIGVNGALSRIRRAPEPPVVPPGFVGDFGGAGMSLVVGLLAALRVAERSGRGQVVDTSIVGSSAVLTGGALESLEAGPAAEAMAAGLAPFYNVYECADHEYVAVGAAEPQFYEALRSLLSLADDRWLPQFDLPAWPARCTELTAAFSQRTRDEWCADPAAASACVTPVLSLAEAMTGASSGRYATEPAPYIRRGQTYEPNVAVTLSLTPARVPSPARRVEVADVVHDWAE